MRRSRIVQMTDSSSQTQTVASPRGRLRRFWLLAVGVMVCMYLYSNRSVPASFTWGHDLDAGLAQAGVKNHLVLAQFGADWCGACKLMDRQVFSRQEVAHALADWVPVHIDVDAHPRLAEKYEVEALPTSIVLSPEGGQISRLEGSMSSEQFLQFLEKSRTLRQSSTNPS